MSVSLKYNFGFNRTIKTGTGLRDTWKNTVSNLKPQTFAWITILHNCYSSSPVSTTSTVFCVMQGVEFSSAGFLGCFSFGSRNQLTDSRALQTHACYSAFCAGENRTCFCPTHSLSSRLHSSRSVQKVRPWRSYFI